jgi:hypothetical protein
MDADYDRRRVHAGCRTLLRMPGTVADQVNAGFTVVWLETAIHAVHAAMIQNSRQG